MANLKEIRNRITSVNSTMQITSAMKMVSAAKLKRAQDAITQMRPYAEKLQEILSNLSSSLDTSENEYAQEREVKNVLIVGVTSNRGLCGGFNNNITKKIKTIATSEYKGCNISVLSVGKKMIDAMKYTDWVSTDAELYQNPEEIWNNLTFNNVSEMAITLMEAYKAERYDKIVIVYNSFRNAAVQIVQNEQFLPIIAPEEDNTTSATDYVFDPSKEEIVKDLIPNSLKVQLYKALLDSHASEHGARMTAMHQATDNASDLKKDLQLTYNKARQAAITNEILEIVGGAEALNN
jgi:F-type H+-transporting ATPase subunit gamma